VVVVVVGNMVEVVELEVTETLMLLKLLEVIALLKHH